MNVNDLPRGLIKKSAQDFIVDEIPAYEPSGDGTHLYIHFRKTNKTTDEAVREIARVLGVERRDMGIAGLKDKLAVTTQWISVPVKPNDTSLDDRVAAMNIDGIEVLAHRRHGNKLKTGHLKGNRFTIIVRDIDRARLVEVSASFDRMRDEGVPNAFGVQRFGRDGDNFERACAWLTGKERAPNDPRLRRFHFSAMQSHVFNAVLEERVQNATWNVPITGDLLKKEETGGLFVCTDVQLDRERAARGELCPTGPIVGDKMRQPEAEAFDLEQRITLPLIEGIDLRRARSLGEGTRRALKLRVIDLSHEVLNESSRGEGGATQTSDERIASSLDEVNSSEQVSFSGGHAAIKVRFVLPKGAYATTVLSNALNIFDAVRDESGATGAPESDKGENDE